MYALQHFILFFLFVICIPIKSSKKMHGDISGVFFFFVVVFRFVLMAKMNYKKISMIQSQFLNTIGITAKCS